MIKRVYDLRFKRWVKPIHNFLVKLPSCRLRNLILRLILHYGMEYGYRDNFEYILQKAFKNLAIHLKALLESDEFGYLGITHD